VIWITPGYTLFERTFELFTRLFQDYGEHGNAKFGTATALCDCACSGAADAV